MSNLQFHKQPGNSALSGWLDAHTTSAPTSHKVNLSAVVDPAVGNDSSQGYSVGSIWINVTLGKAFFCADASIGAAVWTGTGATASITGSITAVNTFSAGNVIRKNGSGYIVALADTEAHARVLGVVSSASGTAFTVVYAGLVTLTAHGFTNGATLFLSPTIDGLLTETEPTTRAQVSKPVAIVLDANTIIVINQRGILVPPQNTGYLTTDITAGGTTSIAPASSKEFQAFSGTLGVAAIIDILRTAAYDGQKFRVILNNVVLTQTRTLTLRENSSGSLVFFPNLPGATVTVSGFIDFVYSSTATAWVVVAQSTQEQ